VDARFATLDERGGLDVEELLDDLRPLLAIYCPTRHELMIRETRFRTTVAS
jgi:hypothetical protein